jgi:site-specific DNA-adenine methylase
MENEMMKQDKKKRPVLSPFRYPGGKRTLAPIIARIMKENALDGIVKPF